MNSNYIAVNTHLLFSFWGFIAFKLQIHFLIVDILGTVLMIMSESVFYHGAGMTSLTQLYHSYSWFNYTKD